MAPAPTEDYYMVLGVKPTAPLLLIVQSYKKLALKLHPDRNHRHDATAAFQLLGKAYETLKDESKRRDYDLIYPSITRSQPSPSSAQQSEALSEAEQIIAIQASKQERNARWLTKRTASESSIFKLQSEVERLEQEIRNLNSIVAAEAAEEAQKNSWGTWLLSPIYQKPEDSEEAKERKDRGRQERRIEKDMKERRLALKKTALKKEESLLNKEKEEKDAADLIDTKKMRVIQDRIWARETREKQEREMVERERIAKIWKQQQQQQRKREQEAAEASRKRQAEERVAEQRRREEQANKMREQCAPHKATTSPCSHDGWWPKVQGRTACLQCYEIWTYLLQCPGCKIKACPKCQSVMRPRTPRNTGRRHRKAPPRVRTPSPGSFYDY